MLARVGLALGVAIAMAAPAGAQSTADNLEKYERLRNKLSDEYVVVGSDTGFSIPAHSRIPADSSIRWADSGLRLGWYTAVLATEHFMLRHPDLYPGFADALDADVDNELYHALGALERLDLTAEPWFPDPCGSAAELNGFFIRDDVPRGFHENFPGQVSSRSDGMTQGYYLNEMSQDQAYHLFLGLAMVKGLVPAGTMVEGKDLRGWASELGERIVRHMAGGGSWLIKNPACGNADVTRGADARAFSRGTAAVGAYLSDGSYNPPGHPLLGFLWEEGRDPSKIDPLAADNHHMLMVTAAAGHGFGDETNQVLVELSELHDWWIYPLIHRAIHGSPEYCANETLVTDKAKWLLDELPKGANVASPYPNGPAVHGFTGSNRFTRPSSEHYYGNGEGQEYNALDYLLLHNVYAIASPTTWDGGGIATLCDGSPIPLPEEEAPDAGPGETPGPGPSTEPPPPAPSPESSGGCNTGGASSGALLVLLVLAFLGRRRLVPIAAVLVLAPACSPSGGGEVPATPPPAAPDASVPAVPPAPDAGIPFDPTSLGIERVVIIGIDGLGGQFLSQQHAPNLSAFASEGSALLEMQATVSTLSSPNWMSFLTAVTPSVHGVRDNGWQPGDSSPPKTVFQAIRDQRPNARLAVVAEWHGFLRLVEPEVLDHSVAANSPEETMSTSLALMESDEPDLLFIHLNHVDHAGHEFGWGGTLGAAGSSDYWDELAKADRLVAEFVQGVGSLGLLESTLIIMVSDHGGNDAKGHGGDSKAERDQYLLMIGAGSAHNVITREVRPWDVPSTVAAVLDVETPGPWIGRPIFEGLETWTGHLAPDGKLDTESSSSWQRIYDNSDDFGTKSLSVWRPTAPAGWASTGDVLGDGTGEPNCQALLVQDDPTLATPPVAFERVSSLSTQLSGFGASLWSPIAAPGFVCLGDVAHTTEGPPPLSAVRCVREGYVVKRDSTKAWSDSNPLWEDFVTLYSPQLSADSCAGFVVRDTVLDDPGYPKYYELDATRID